MLAPQHGSLELDWIGQLGDIEPAYEDLPGWHSSTVGASELKALPKSARPYLDRMEELCRLPSAWCRPGLVAKKSS